ncbi:MAG: hypothetical protein FJ319_01480 [SAR202 cluster bacterium]|nr:hypothetical protein [SAR202 cluster bacterium]
MTAEQTVKTPARLGEVVQSSTAQFVASCHRLYEAPALGTLVKCGNGTIVYGVVADVRTQSIDPGRKPIAMGGNDESEEAVYRRNPQISRLLTTEFTAVSAGYKAGGRVRRYLPPLPPRIHSFVLQCSMEELAEFTASMDFLPAMLSAPVGHPDDMVASFLRLASEAHPDPDAFLVTAGKELSRQLNGQWQRLNGILKRLSS